MRRWSFLLFLLLLWCSSCATLPVGPSSTPSPQELLAEIRDRFQALQGIKGLAHVRVSAPGKYFTAQEVILARRPGFLRLESLSALGTPHFYLVTNGPELFIYHPGENRYYRGASTAQHLSSILPVALEPEEIIAHLLGGFPILSYYEEASVQYHAQEDLWFLQLTRFSGKERQTIGIHRQSRNVLSAEYRLHGTTRRLSFSDFRPAPELLFPYKIHFESPEAKTRFTVEYTDLETNPAWEDQDFHLPVPRGAQVIPLK
jgi:outer membrane lipoprotein-sorting protein